MKLIIISPPDYLYHELETIVQLFEHNLDYYHLRKPNFSEQEYEEFIISLPQNYRHKIIIHNYHQLAIKYQLKGVHFSSYTQSFSPNQPSNYNYHQSKSCHSISEITQLKRLYDYVFLSPIFDSISKQGYQTKFNQQELKQFLTTKNSSPEIIALGGIEIDKIAQVKELGFDGVAVLGAIWQQETMEKKLDKFQQLQAQLHFS
jgi:thiamine-phosphate pyrophosphorylase